MIKAFLYDNVTGEVHQGLFTGVDCLGNGQWLNISRDDEPFSINHRIYGSDTHSLRILSADDNPIPSKLLAKVLSYNIRTYGYICQSLDRVIYRMKNIGLEWYKESLALEFVIVKNEDEFGFRLETLGGNKEYFETVMGFDNMTDLFECIKVYINTLENDAEIPVRFKRLSVNKTLKRSIKKTYLKIFDEVGDLKD